MSVSGILQLSETIFSKILINDFIIEKFCDKYKISFLRFLFIILLHIILIQVLYVIEKNMSIQYNYCMNKGEFTKKFGLKLKLERTRLNVSQEKLAELSGLNQKTISMIECGKNSPTIETINSIAGALKIAVEDLIKVDKIDL